MQEEPSQYAPITDIRHETLDRQISLLELKLALQHLKNGKAPEPDNISNEFLKNLPTTGIELLHSIVNQIFDFKPPVEWCELETTMYYKKEDPDDPANYCPIALANTSMKLFTNII
ncbi:unnamed protein product [Allacma fusca]|uniref:Uncharacterized protein n=1 Tax=Allacma fusca TaxID=39272 RepID=A0A8J2LDC7_9HEXA|nr:unnamed protein product [Allacma fusca]